MVSADAASDHSASVRRAATVLMYRSHVDVVWGYALGHGSDDDHRSVTMNVAGPAAPMVAKLRKLWERTIWNAPASQPWP